MVDIASDIEVNPGQKPKDGHAAGLRAEGTSVWVAVRSMFTKRCSLCELTRRCDRSLGNFRFHSAGCIVAIQALDRQKE
jgi:hypothetical protein